jgi:hypothetical protein
MTRRPENIVPERIILKCDTAQLRQQLIEAKRGRDVGRLRTGQELAAGLGGP